MSNRLLAAVGMVVISIILAGGFLVSTAKLDLILSSLKRTNEQVTSCASGETCWRFKHESELILPPRPKEGCGPFVLPELDQAPPPSTIEIPADAPDRVVVELLLEYIDRVLAHDQKSKEALLKHYQEYTNKCAEKPDSVKTE